MGPDNAGITREEITVPAGRVILRGTLEIPAGAAGMVVIAHGIGSTRCAPWDSALAEALRQAGFATLLAHLLTDEEAELDERTGHLRFDVGLLAQRLVAIIDATERHAGVGGLPLGVCGASTGAAAALIAAARRPARVSAVVLPGGRPDLALPLLSLVRAPTLLVVGGRDAAGMEMNRRAMPRLRGAMVRLEIVRGAGHLFEETGAQERLVGLAQAWFARFLVAAPAPA